MDQERLIEKIRQRSQENKAANINDNIPFQKRGEFEKSYE